MKKLIAGVFCLVVLFWGGSWYFLYARLPGLTERGQFGDMFGAVNSLFSGLAFAGIVIAILLQRQELQQQREELKLQREELKLTRKELQRSAVAQEKSEEALSEQVETLRTTAKVQALTALVNVHAGDVARVSSPEKAAICADELEIALTGFGVELLRK